MFELQMELYVTHIGYEASESNCSSFPTFSPSVPWVGVGEREMTPKPTCDENPPKPVLRSGCKRVVPGFGLQIICVCLVFIFEKGNIFKRISLGLLTINYC